MPDKLNYKLIDHTADIGIETAAPSLEELFRKCGLIVFDLITDLGKVEPKEELEFEIEEKNIEDLLVRFLNELLYYFGAKHFLGCDFEVKLDVNKIRVKMMGEYIDFQRHFIKEEIKAATYHDFLLEKRDSGYRVRIIFDI